MHNPAPTPPDEDMEVFRPIWKHFKAMLHIAAGDPVALAHRAAADRFLADQAQRVPPLKIARARLKSHGIYVDEIYETKDGNIQIEKFGDARRIAQRLTEAGFNVLGFEKDEMSVEVEGDITWHDYALIRIDVDGLR